MDLTFDLETRLWILASALVLDAFVGEPGWLWRRIPHPAVVMGHAVGKLDETMNDPKQSPGQRQGAGQLAVLVLLLWAVLPGVIIPLLPLGAMMTALFAAILLAQKSLSSHVHSVAEGLDIGLVEGRQAVSQIVGRSPDKLDYDGVSRAAIESCAENFSDGVVAPAFWFALFGLPGLLVYKTINTADSMIGHQTDRHRAFGRSAAKLDDLLNWAPARLSALMLGFMASKRPSLRQLQAEAAKHRSPNAGWPEAAMAVALGLALAGPRTYASGVVTDPWLNEMGRKDANTADIRASVRLIWMAWGLMTATIAGAAFIL